MGTATTGSSEAAQLGGLAMKRIWQEKRKLAGKSLYEPSPNIVMGANAQVALEKFARYFDVECRLVPVTAQSRFRLDPKKAMKYVDENTIGVFVILGSAYRMSNWHAGMTSLLDYLQAPTLATTNPLRRCPSSWTSTKKRQVITCPFMVGRQLHRASVSQQPCPSRRRFRRIRCPIRHGRYFRSNQ